MRKLITLLAVLAFCVAPVLTSQTLPNFERWLGADMIGPGITAISTDLAMGVKFDAEGSTGTIAVAAGGDITFLKDGAAVTGFECPVAAPLGGVIDVSDADCNTFAEVVDIINNDTDGEWKAVLLGALRTDSSDNTLITLVAADANTGIELLFDGTITDEVNMLFSTKVAATDYITGGLLQQDPYGGTRILIDRMEWKTTHDGGGANSATISCVERNYIGITATETVSNATVFTGGATTVATLLDHADWGFGFLGCKNGALHVRIVDVAPGNLTVAEFTSHAVEMEIP